MALCEECGGDLRNGRCPQCVRTAPDQPDLASLDLPDLPSAESLPDLSGLLGDAEDFARSLPSPDAGRVGASNDGIAGDSAPRHHSGGASDIEAPDATVLHEPLRPSFPDATELRAPAPPSFPDETVLREPERPGFPGDDRSAPSPVPADDAPIGHFVAHNTLPPLDARELHDGISTRDLDSAANLVVRHEREAPAPVTASDSPVVPVPLRAVDDEELETLARDLRVRATGGYARAERGRAERPAPTSSAFRPHAEVWADDSDAVDSDAQADSASQRSQTQGSATERRSIRRSISDAWAAASGSVQAVPAPGLIGAVVGIAGVIGVLSLLLQR